MMSIFSTKRTSTNRYFYYKNFTKHPTGTTGNPIEYQYLSGRYIIELYFSDTLQNLLDLTKSSDTVMVYGWLTSPQDLIPLGSFSIVDGTDESVTLTSLPCNNFITNSYRLDVFFTHGVNNGYNM